MTSQNVTRTTEQTSFAGNGHTRTSSIEEAMIEVDQRMNNIVDSDVDVLRDASRHILEAGGKRVRPRLTLLSFMATGGKDASRVTSVAAALELVHTASVVHDDINDHGVVRRGRPSVNSIWGRTFALLTGDFLFTKVYELMAPYGAELNQIFSEATTALVEGETLQAAAVKDNNLTQEVYFEVIARKTAALFKAGGILGAKLAGADPDEAEALGRYGYNVGLAFQIVDDILDLIGDEEQLGKTAGIDGAQGKGFSNVTDDPFEAIKAKALEGNRIAEGRTQAQHLVEMAIAELSVLRDSRAKQELISLAHQIVNRSN